MIKKYNLFKESKNKFPNIQKKDIDGFVVYIGKDSKSNDHLTFNVADEDDLWFHVKGQPGSHIIIKINGKLPTPEVLKEVAILAKKNSKAKDLDKATVVYCKRKFVKKLPGMNDGQVQVDYKNSNDININE